MSPVLDSRSSQVNTSSATPTDSEPEAIASPVAPSPAVARALDEVEQQFVELWRNMAALWGISPTMAQIHGLLFITGAALSVAAALPGQWGLRDSHPFLSRR